MTTAGYPWSTLAIIVGLSAIVLWLLMMRYIVPLLALPLPGPSAAATPETCARAHQLLHQVLAPARSMAEQRGVMLTSDVSPSVPNVLEGDADGFTECLSHMVSSALIRTARGGIHVHVEARPPAGGSRIDLLVSITDTSEAIPRTRLRNLLHSTPGWKSVAKIARRSGGYTWTGRGPGGGAIAGFTISMRTPVPEALTRELIGAG